MGCNHCVEPTCLSGCPVDAYTKDPITGIVRHSADACIGCQVLHLELFVRRAAVQPRARRRRQVRHVPRTARVGPVAGLCRRVPEGAIAIEIVNIAEWRAGHCRAPPPGVPAGDGSLSTTRITMPATLPPNTKPMDLYACAAGEPHWPLVVMTVLTQLSVGAFADIWLLQLAGDDASGVAALTSLAVAGLALGASTLHLGRPIHAYRALKMWRRSWLSREVVLFSAFSALQRLCAVSCGSRSGRATATLGGLTVLRGLAGVSASGCIYRVESRPSWNSPLTLVQFPLTAACSGRRLPPRSAPATPLARAGGAALAGMQLVLLALRFFRLIAADSVELRGTARLLSTVLVSRFLARGLLLAAVGSPCRCCGRIGLVGWVGLRSLCAWQRAAWTLSLLRQRRARHMAAPYLALEVDAA